jgi:hypothetical protein
MGSNAIELVLCILPTPEPKDIIQNLKDAHPNIDVKYIQQAWGRGPQRVELPDGRDCM